MYFSPTVHNFTIAGSIITAVSTIVTDGVMLGKTLCENSCTRPPVIDATSFEFGVIFKYLTASKAHVNKPNFGRK